MDRIETRLNGPVLVRPIVHEDERGFFLETYRKSAFADLGIMAEFVQDNHSRSVERVVRGMHYALPPGQAKLIRCGRGSIYDVVVDLRAGSPTFGEWEAFELSDRNHHQLFIPVGFGHGFCVTSAVADVLYACTAYYDPMLERALAYDDPAVGIEWPYEEMIASDRDTGAPRLAQIAQNPPFTYGG